MAPGRAPRLRKTAQKSTVGSSETCRLLHGVAWVIAALSDAFAKGQQSPEFISLLYLHYAVRDRLTFDFVTQVLWDKGYASRPVIQRTDLLDPASRI